MVKRPLAPTKKKIEKEIRIYDTKTMQERLPLWRSGNAPMPVIDPCTLLAFFAAIFGASAPTTFGKLSWKLFPFPAFVVGTLPDAASGIVLAAKVAHNHAGPILHLRRVMSYSKFLHQRKDVVIIWQEIFFFGLWGNIGLDHFRICVQ